MQNVLEKGPDFWHSFDPTQFSYHCVHPIHAKVFSIQMLATFLSNCAKGLHFSAFHFKYEIIYYNYQYKFYECEKVNVTIILQKTMCHTWTRQRMLGKCMVY